MAGVGARFIIPLPSVLAHLTSSLLGHQGKENGHPRMLAGERPDPAGRKTWLARSRLGVVNGKQAQGGGHPSLTCVLRKSILQLSWTRSSREPRSCGQGCLVLYLVGSGQRTAQDASLAFFPSGCSCVGWILPAVVGSDSSPPTLNSCRLYLKGGVNAFPGRELSPTLEKRFALLPIPAFFVVPREVKRKKKRKEKKNIYIYTQNTERLIFHQIPIQIFKQQPPTPQTSFPAS